MPRFFTGMAVGAVAVLTLTGTAYAATGGTFVLGRNNAASSQTLLTSSGSGPVLALSTRSGQVPLAVSAGAGKATNLNADRVDGLEGAQLQRRLTRGCPAGSAVAVVDVGGEVTCADSFLETGVADVSNPSGVVRVPCPRPRGTAVSGGYLLPQGVVAVATGSSVYVDGTDGSYGYNARFTNLDGTAYTGSVSLNVVCSYDVLGGETTMTARRAAPAGPPPLR